MAHRHNWKPYGGIAENPGVYSEGRTLRKQSECACGARHLVITSVVPDERGQYVRIVGPQGCTERDTRDWR